MRPRRRTARPTRRNCWRRCSRPPNSRRTASPRRQIAEAAARLAANARDPKVAAAIRRQQDAGQALAELYRERDDLVRGAVPGTVAPPPAPVTAAELDKHIAAAQSEQADADAALHAAAPNYGQLVQEVVPAADVLAALRPGEAFVAITLAGNSGWVFALRDGQIDAAPLRIGTAAVQSLVHRVRAGIELTDAGVPRFDTGAAHALYEGYWPRSRRGWPAPRPWWWRRPGRCSRCPSQCC